MILSPIMSFIVDREMGFPAPSERDKINKVLKRYRYILSKNPHRSDTPELMFGIADLLVGRNSPGDYREAEMLYDQILMRHIPESLRARALVGKAELLIGNPEEFDNAISLCERARKISGKDFSDFFLAKTFVVEAELLLSRNKNNDWKNAVKLVNRLSKSKAAHWYFKGRGLLTKTEITLYQNPKNLNAALKVCDKALKELKSREDDYFINKGKLLKAEILIRRAKKIDLDRAEKLLGQVLQQGRAFSDLVARAKLNLADIVHHPKAFKLLKEVSEMDGLDPYLLEKAKIIEKAVRDKKKGKK